VNRRFAILAGVFVLATAGALAESQTAEAGRYRFSGGGRFSARAGGGVSVHYSRPAYGGYRSYGGGYRAYRGGFYNRGWGVRGSVYVGPRFGYYPGYYGYYPRTYYYYNPVPSYYGVYSYSQPYYPVAPAPVTAPSTVAVVAARPELPRFGVGLFAGGAAVEGTNGGDTKDSSDIGLLGRYRLTQGLLVEAEVGKTSYEENLRVDRRIGGSLVYEIGAYNKLAPYVLAGLGVQQAEVGGQFETRQNFGELGIGLRYAATPHLHLLFDVRAGSRATADSDDTTRGDIATRTIAPPTVDSNEGESYTRARFAAVLYF
jgi:hypothetical protein